MDSHLHIQLAVDDYIRKAYAERDDLKNFLLNHERKHVCVSNLLREINMTALRNPKLLKSNDNIMIIISEFAKVFCQLAIKTKEVSEMSSLEKHFATREAERFEEVAKLAEGIKDSSMVI